MAGALARGDRAVIADPDGSYLKRFYDASRGDAILNPFDERAARWDLFAEFCSRTMRICSRARSFRTTRAPIATGATTLARS